MPDSSGKPRLPGAKAKILKQTKTYEKDKILISNSSDHGDGIV